MQVHDSDCFQAAEARDLQRHRVGATVANDSCCQAQSNGFFATGAAGSQCIGMVPGRCRCITADAVGGLSLVVLQSHGQRAAACTNFSLHATIQILTITNLHMHCFGMTPGIAMCRCITSDAVKGLSLIGCSATDKAQQWTLIPRDVPSVPSAGLA